MDMTRFWFMVLASFCFVLFFCGCLIMHAESLETANSPLKIGYQLNFPTIRTVQRACVDKFS